MFTFADKVVFSRAREVGMGVFVGFVVLGTGASLSPAADVVAVGDAGTPAPQWSPAPSAHNFFYSVTHPEPASTWLYSVAGGLCF